MLKYGEFKQGLIRELKRCMGMYQRILGEYEITEIGTVYTNNMEMEGIEVHKKDSRIGVLLYPQEIYIRYLQGEKLKDILDNWVRKFLKEVDKLPETEKIWRIWEHSKTRATIALINRERNKNFLKEIPWRKLGETDLAIGYVIPLNTTSIYFVKNIMLNEWGITEDELYRSAFQNLQEEKGTFAAGRFMVSKGALEWETIDLLKEQGFRYDPLRIYYISVDRQYGAAACMNERLMASVRCLLGEEFMLLPFDVNTMVIAKVDIPEIVDKNLRFMEEIEKYNGEPRIYLSNKAHLWRQGKLSIME